MIIINALSNSRAAVQPGRQVPYTEAIALMLGSYKSDITKVAGESKSLFVATAESKLGKAALISLAAATGFGVGYWFGYEPDMDCKNSAIIGYLKGNWLAGSACTGRRILA